LIWINLPEGKSDREKSIRSRFRRPESVRLAPARKCAPKQNHDRRGTLEQAIARPYG